MWRLASSVFPLGWSPGVGVRQSRERYSPVTGAGSSLFRVFSATETGDNERQPSRASCGGCGAEREEGGGRARAYKGSAAAAGW
ncbi:uncharacterized protein M421DRAFT_419407 [Didymella exigua CBS 183.55]|uniref:Uncharacterized protein n=1 Tax=Didymella exigua CBS 183.55 TaxID=1150837 RepID=A0A6A5RPN9_9PLEO|nr:uncharacterized protein M421DRAFT_419407 [Didymella exigua CBS 183.55]KAF1929619.1 hypothetical protein M421DRAFT_419407 [Didymella exigua CBS 183.55]